MKIIEQSFKFLSPIDGEEMLRQIETAGRTCYRSESKTTQDSAYTFCKNMIKSGHEAMLEFASFGVRFITSRSVSHELVRHRVCSFAQESQRYCNYGKDKYGNEITFIKPVYLTEGTTMYDRWYTACQDAEAAYLDMLEMGAKPEEAREVLSNSTRTEICMKANIREWRHFFSLRCDNHAHPQIRALAKALLEECKMYIPVLFDDLFEDS